MSDTDLMALYSRRLLALAADIDHVGRLDDPDGSVMKRSPQCGSSVTADLRISQGKIVEFAQEIRACALGQASAAVLGKVIIGCDHADLVRAVDELAGMLAGTGPVPAAPFDGLEALLPAREFPNRHASVMLAWQAALAAFEQAQSAQ